MDNINPTPGARFDAKTILLWVLIGVIAFTGYFGWQWREIKKELDNQTKRVEDLLKQISDFQNKNNLIEDETAGWKTYRNEQYGFEMKYPDSLMKLTEGTIAQGGEIYNITLNAKERRQVNGNNFSVYDIEVAVDNNRYNSNDAYFEKMIEYLKSSVEPNPYRLVEFAGKKWIETWGYPGLYGTTQLATPHNGYIYTFKFSSLGVGNISEIPTDSKSAEGLGKLKQILSTFKFTNKLQNSVWKTYRNEDQGFEFKYPNNWFTKEQSDKLIGLCPNQGGLPCKTDIDGFAADISITIKDNSKQLGLRNYLESQGFNLTLEGIGIPSDIIVDGHEALRFGAEGTALATIFIKNKAQVIVLQALATQKDTRVFDNITATFKFIN